MITPLVLLLAGLGPGLVPRFAAAQAQCFNLDGTQVTQPDFVPCSDSGSAVTPSMCCGLRRPQQQAVGGGLAATAPPDLCAANGLCQSLVVDNQGNQRVLFVRASCTRPDWVGCLKNVCPRISGVSARPPWK